MSGAPMPPGGTPGGASGTLALPRNAQSRKPRNFYRVAGKRIGAARCVCGGAKTPGIMFCTPCLADIDDQGLRRQLYRPGHAAHKFWAAVEHLSRHGSASRAPAYRQLEAAHKARPLAGKETTNATR